MIYRVSIYTHNGQLIRSWLAAENPTGLSGTKPIQFQDLLTDGSVIIHSGESLMTVIEYVPEERVQSCITQLKQ